ncbi:FAD-dependent oxidoreductase [Balamuthia mandrillaris]
MSSLRRSGCGLLSALPGRGGLLPVKRAASSLRSGSVPLASFPRFHTVVVGRAYSSFPGERITTIPNTAVAATIENVHSDTPSVYSFVVDVQNPPMAFGWLPGQWFDIFLPKDAPAGLNKKTMSHLHKRKQITGYTLGLSACSAPNMGMDGCRIQFAAQLSPHPIVQHLHNKAEIGDILYLDGGHGSFHYHLAKDKRDFKSLVLIGGGIGITPLMGITRYVFEATRNMVTHGWPMAKRIRVKMVHSAKRPSELLFVKEMRKMAEAEGGIIGYYPTVTRLGENGEEEEEDDRHKEKDAKGRPIPWNGLRGRVDEKMLKEQVKISPDDWFYLCGPVDMVQSTKDLLVQQCNVPEHNIFYEKWSTENGELPSDHSA